MKGWVFIFGAQGPYLVLISYKIVPLLEPHFTAQGFLQLCSLSEKVARLNNIVAFCLLFSSILFWGSSTVHRIVNSTRVKENEESWRKCQGQGFGWEGHFYQREGRLGHFYNAILLTQSGQWPRCSFNWTAWNKAIFFRNLSMHPSRRITG